METYSFDETVPPQPPSAQHSGATRLRERASDIGRKAAAAVDGKRGAIASGFDALLIRINPREPEVPVGHVSLPLGALAGLEAILPRTT